MNGIPTMQSRSAAITVTLQPWQLDLLEELAERVGSDPERVARVCLLQMLLAERPGMQYAAALARIDRAARRLMGEQDQSEDLEPEELEQGSMGLQLDRPEVDTSLFYGRLIPAP